jgi:hypothetical protein
MLIGLKAAAFWCVLQARALPQTISRIDEDPLCRGAGYLQWRQIDRRCHVMGRSLKVLAPFQYQRPFFGLTIPPDVAVTAQVVAR